MNKKRALAFFMAFLVLFGMLPVCSFGTKQYAYAGDEIDGSNEIVARANYLYNITWTCTKDVYGWKNQNIYKAGETYHIPYGQPVSAGKYIYWGVSINDFLQATRDPDSVFYTERGGGVSSTYYAMDCSAFVSYCWGLPKRYTTSSWSKLDVTTLGKCVGENIQDLQKGDALNVAGYHIVLVTDVLKDAAGRVIQVEITEQTIPQAKKTMHTISSLEAIYKDYIIYRYNQRDSVGLPGNDECRCTSKYSGVYSSDDVKEDMIIYSSHDVTSEAIGTIAQGTRVRILKGNGTWGHVEYEGISGYIPMDKLRMLSAAASYSPLGTIEEVDGRTGTIAVSGWVFDEDDVSHAVEIHVYVGGDASSQAPGYRKFADKYRPDVEAIYPGIGDHHGIGSLVHTPVIGDVDVFIYAINIKTGGNVFMGSYPVTILPDESIPTLDPPTISDQAPNTFTLQGKTTDEVSLDYLYLKVWPTDTPDLSREYRIACRDIEEYDYKIEVNLSQFERNITEVSGELSVFDTSGNSRTESFSTTLPKSEYTITYDTVYGQTTLPDMTVRYQSSWQVPTTIPTYERATFAGWNTQKDGSGIWYEPGQESRATEDMTLYAQWKSNLPFTDIGISDWRYDVAQYVYSRGIIKGTTATTFSPQDVMTRGQFVTILWRMEGSPKTELSGLYSDIPDTSYCANAVAWAKNNRLAYGMSDGNFHPNDPITREQFMAFVYRYINFKKLDVSVEDPKCYLACEDGKSVSETFSGVIAWAYERGFIAATGKLNCKGRTTRMEAATILMRIIQKYEL